MTQHEELFCSLDSDGGPGMGGTGPPGPGVDAAGPAQSFQPAAEPGGSHTFRGDDGRVHFNLLGWDGTGGAPHLFPDGGAT